MCLLMLLYAHVCVCGCICAVLLCTCIDSGAYFHTVTPVICFAHMCAMFIILCYFHYCSCRFVSDQLASVQGEAGVIGPAGKEW